VSLCKKAWAPLTVADRFASGLSARYTQNRPSRTATLYIESTIDSPLFVPATGGLDVGAIPNEITTRIILNSGKSTILAQAVNIGAKGVK